MYISTTSSTLLNFKLILKGQGHMVFAFLRARYCGNPRTVLSLE